jgi:hypothetical protein
MGTAVSSPFSIRVLSGIVAPTFELNINNDSWFANSSRDHSEWAGSFLHKNGVDCIEFNYSQHARGNSDHTSIRKTSFFADAPPTTAYLWPEQDPFISEVDNLIGIYMPWRNPQLLMYGNVKMIDIDTPAAIWRDMVRPEAGVNTIEYVAGRTWTVGEWMVRARGPSGFRSDGITNTNQQHSRLWPWECTVGGVSTAEPVWPTNIPVTNGIPNATISQNGVTWVARPKPFHPSNHPTWAFDTVDFSPAAGDSRWSKYNPATLMNGGDLNFALMIGGGNQANARVSGPRTVAVIDDNPNYPASSTKPLRFRQRWVTTAAYPRVPYFPMGYSRNMSKVGDWFYWGGCGMDTDTPANEWTFGNKFFRIHLPTLVSTNLTIVQEQLPDKPGTSVATKGPCIFADEPRRRLIYLNHEGAWVWQIPSDHSLNGTWHGPFTVPNWVSTIRGNDNDWRGFQGIHRSDLNQTFFRYNLGRKWNRIRWVN